MSTNFLYDIHSLTPESPIWQSNTGNPHLGTHWEPSELLTEREYLRSSWLMFAHKPAACQHRKHIILPISRARQVLPAFHVPPALKTALVSLMRLRQHVHCRGLQYCARLSVDIHLQAIHEELGCHDSGRNLHQSDANLHGNSSAEYGHRYSAIGVADTDDRQAADAQSAKGRLDLHFWRGLSVGKIPT